MKVQGPGDAPLSPPVAETGAADRASPVEQVASTTDVSASDAIRALAEDLRAGRVSSREAVERLVDDAVARLGSVVSPEAAGRLRAALLDLAAQDPHLSAKIRLLGER